MQAAAAVDHGDGAAVAGFYAIGASALEFDEHRIIVVFQAHASAGS